MTTFDPITALGGGVLIGLAAGLLWLLAGRVAGISGILASALTLNVREGSWRWMFLAGMIGASALMKAIDAGYFPHGVDGHWVVALVAGALVGLGTRIGGGCTSGHGVCGISRLSLRSVTATVVFTIVAALTLLADRALG